MPIATYCKYSSSGEGVHVAHNLYKTQCAISLGLARYSVGAKTQIVLNDGQYTTHVLLTFRGACIIKEASAL